MKRLLTAALAALVTLAPLSGRSQAASTSALDLNVTRWQIISRDSGPVNYYRSVLDPALPFVQARYVPPTKTAVLGFQVADDDRQRARAVRWQWRAVTLPRGGNECADGKSDSAAVVYLTWKRTFRYYTLKYVWSAGAPVGSICERKRSPFVAQDTVVLESGAPLGVWRSESIDLKAEFRKHFEDGNPNADVPDFGGIGIMTDGDQTNSESAADYAGFILDR